MAQKMQAPCDPVMQKLKVRLDKRWCTHVHRWVRLNKPSGNADGYWLRKEGRSLSSCWCENMDRWDQWLTKGPNMLTDMFSNPPTQKMEAILHTLQQLLRFWINLKWNWAKGKKWTREKILGSLLPILYMVEMFEMPRDMTEHHIKHHTRDFKCFSFISWCLLKMECNTSRSFRG